MTAFFVYCDIYKEKEQHGVALTYECNEQSTAELQKLSVFHTTVTYATAKLHILFEMDNQNTENNVNKHVFSSSEAIDKVLNAIGLTRDALSTYQQYQYPNGDYLRLRVSNHGIFLQHWFDKNREARMDGQNVPKLDVGLNLAITFAPNEQECLAMGKPFPMKIKNVTAAKTQQGNNVKPQFKVRHICYYSWMLTREDVDTISASLSNCVTNGEDYKEPLQGNPDKVVEWEDISNLPPKKVEGNTLQQSKDNNKLNTEQYMNKKQIRLTESDLKQIVKESISKILSEAKKKDPMQQWFKDMEDIQKYRNNMEYITKGGSKPKHWKKDLDENSVTETRFLPLLQKTYENLRREYEHWQYAKYKPQGMDNAISAILKAMFSVQEVIWDIEPSDNIPTWEDPQPY